MLVHRIERDWYSLMDQIEGSDEKTTFLLRKQLRESLIAASPAFSAKPFFLSEEYSLVDCYLAPLLWRLGSLGIDLPANCGMLQRYAQRLFERDAFQSSLSAHERDLPAFGKHGMAH